MNAVKQDPVRIARELSEARPHLEHHDVLRRRLAALPWERDVELALEVEMQVKEPNRLDHLSRRIPFFTAHLANRSVEDSSYRLHLWQPERTHPTLVPIPEHDDRPVLQPVSALDEAHEAMLEAMDEEHTEVEQPVVETEEENFREDEIVREDGLTDHEFWEDEKWSAERWRWWREKHGEKEEKTVQETAQPVVEDVLPVAIAEEENAEMTDLEEPANEEEVPSRVEDNEAATQSVAVEEAISEDVATQRALDALRELIACLLYTSPSPRDRQKSRMPSSA